MKSPHKNGEKKQRRDKRRDKRGIKQTYFWLMYCDKDEIAFTWSNSRGFLHVQNRLKYFAGTLLTDGYAAYNKTVAKLNEKENFIIHAACWMHTRHYFDGLTTDY